MKIKVSTHRPETIVYAMRAGLPLFFQNFMPLLPVFFLFIFSTTKILACNCPDIKPLDKEIIQKKFPVIFYGRVAGFSHRDGKLFVKFKVIEPYAGKLREETEIIDPDSDCSPGFAPGQEWLVYASYLEYGKAGTDICTPSRKYFEKETDDFNKTMRGTTFEQDKIFLRTNFGIQPFYKSNKEEESLSQRELLKPKGFGMVWMIIIGTLVLAVFYYLFNKFFK